MSLVPSAEFDAALPGPPPPAPGGRTLRAGDPGPSAAALGEYRAEQARRKVQGWTEWDLAEARAGAGGGLAYAGKLRSALQAQLDARSGATLSPHAFDNLLRGWSAMGDRYGKTGSPFAAGERESPTALLNPDGRLMSEMARDPTGAAGQAALALQQCEAFVAFAEGKFGDRLTAVVELRQGPDGRHLGSSLETSSGNRAFDALALEVLPKAAEALGPPTPDEQRLRPLGLRTHWLLEGRLTFLTPAKDLTWREIAALALQQAVVSLLGGACKLPGRFDETTGAIEFVDLSNARLTTRVRLLRVF